MIKRKVTLLFGIILFTLTLGFRSSSFGQLYTITDVGTKADWYSEAHGINSTGSVVGEYELTNSIAINAFLFTDGIRTNLGNLGGNPYAAAYGINGTNQIVGESNKGIDTHAFLYTNGAMSDLGTLGGAFIGGYSSAHAINQSGQIVGESSTSFMQANTIHAVLYSGTNKTDLGALGGNYSSANAINSSGIIVGESDIVQSGVTNVHGFVFTNSPMQDLGTLGGSYSSAKGINDSNVIVGEAESVIAGVTNLHAFVYQNGVMTDVGTLGGSASSASAINNLDQIVGYATDSNEVSCAFLYTGSTMINLNNQIPPGSGWTNLTSADAINDAGQIAGSGYLVDGSFHAYLLTPSGSLTVAITNPAPHAIFGAPASFDIGATAYDIAGIVTNIQFFANSNLVGNATSIPYSVSVTNLAAGGYKLTAIASDDAGLFATNSISITVTNNGPSPITLLNPAVANNEFSFSFATDSGFNYEGQYTTPLSFTNTWVSFTNLTGTGSTVRVTNSSLTDMQRYYRVIAH